MIERKLIKKQMIFIKKFKTDFFLCLYQKFYLLFFYVWIWKLGKPWKKHGKKWKSRSLLVLSLSVLIFISFKIYQVC